MKYLVYLSRIVVGSVFVVSGLIKANDTLGFSYKLEEYFLPNALGSFWTMFYDYSLPLAIIVCVAEVVLGLSLIFGTKFKITVIAITGFLVFFGFLTYYTAQCDPHAIITYTNSAGEEVTGTPMCVLDCGCFGDALKGSLGRSLTPWESFQKDMVLLVFTVFLFFGFKSQSLNNERKDKLLIGGSLAFTAGFSGYVFGWWMPLSFLAIAALLYLLIKWFYVKKGREWIILGMLVFISSAFAWYTLNYLPVKDYRPYAVGNNVTELMKTSDQYREEYRQVFLNEIMAGYQSDMEADFKQYLEQDTIYRKGFESDSAQIEYERSIFEEIKFGYEGMAYEKADSLAVDSMERNNLLPPVYYSMYYLQNKETKERDYFKSTDYMANRMWETWEYVYVMVNPKTGETQEVAKSEFNEEEWAEKGFEKKSFESVLEKEGYEAKIPAEFNFNDESANDKIQRSDTYTFLAVCWDLDLTSKKGLQKLNKLNEFATENGYNFIAATSTMSKVDSVIARNELTFNFISGDDKVLKTIVRSNPGVIVLKNGTILGKWGTKTIPSPKRMSKYLMKLER
jgi:uncharacterized membrane protein YphA (DoxX/SURF4 family)